MNKYEVFDTCGDRATIRAGDSSPNVQVEFREGRFFASMEYREDEFFEFIKALENAARDAGILSDGRHKR